MFILTQFIGLFVVNHYINDGNALPFGLETPQPNTQAEYSSFFVTIIFAFIVAILIFFLLTRMKIEFVLRAWFFIVVTIALTISLTSVFSLFTTYTFIAALLVAVALASLKIFGRNFLVHNFTELFIYPGIAAVFVPILNLYTVLALLVLISIYDIWAVWHSGIMQKMAKYQIDKVRVFSGFFVPYMAKGMRAKVKNWKKTLSKSQLNKKKIKVNVAILGGGDVVFPIITSGVVLKTAEITMPFGLKQFVGGFGSALFVIFGATLGLSYLFLVSEKKKFYPAMPFITAGIVVGMVLGWLIL